MPRRRWIIAGSAVLLLVVLVAARNLVASDGDGAAAGGPGEGVWLALTGDGSGDFGEGTEHRIRLVNMRDGNEREVGDELAYTGVEWAPDGSRLLAIDMRGGGPCITLLEPESGDQTEVACGPLPMLGGMWSADGSRFLLANLETGFAHLYDRDGVRLAERELAGGTWHWSPADTLILASDEVANVQILSGDDLSVIHQVTEEEALTLLDESRGERARIGPLYWLTSNQFLVTMVGEWDDDLVTVVVGVVRDGEVFLERRRVPPDAAYPFDAAHPFGRFDAGQVDALAGAVIPGGSSADVSIRRTADGVHAWAIPAPAGRSPNPGRVAVAVGDEVLTHETALTQEAFFGTFRLSVVVIE